MKKLKLSMLFIISILIVSCSSVDEITVNETFESRISSLNENIDLLKTALLLPRNTKLENSFIDTLNKTMTLEFNRDLTVVPFREENVNEIYRFVKDSFGPQFENYNFKLTSMGYPLENLIPNYLFN